MSRIRLPLDSPNWLPMADAHRQVWNRTGDRFLAANDLTEAMAAKRVRSMRRSHRSGERELLQWTFWREHKLDSSSDALFVVPRVEPLPDAGEHAATFYVWEPDLKKIFGIDAARPEQQPQAVGSSRKRGRPRQHEWPEIAAEIALRVCKTMRAKSDSDIVEDVLHLCRQRWDKEPAVSELHEYVSAMRLRFPRQKK